jgi:hypothetical protein
LLLRTNSRQHLCPVIQPSWRRIFSPLSVELIHALLEEATDFELDAAFRTLRNINTASYSRKLTSLPV